MTAARVDSSLKDRIRAKAVEVFGADLRALAALRIALAILVLIDLANRATDLRAHYTDEGVLPRAVVMEQLLSPWSFSLNLMNGQLFFQALLFVATAMAALGLLLGYRTRLMTFVVWVLMLSIQLRAPLVGGADGPLLRLLLFWSIFLPLGAYWSLDRTLKGPDYRPSTRFLSVATVGLFMQIAFMYWFSALLKSGAEWRQDGTALYYALSLDQIATPLGTYLLNFPTLLQIMTVATFALEAFGPFLLFCPFFTGPVRTAAAASFMGLHFGIWLTMDIGIFSWISAFCMVCFLPEWFWENAARLTQRLDTGRWLPRATEGLGRVARSISSALSSLEAAGRQPSLAGLAGRGEGDPKGGLLARLAVPLASSGVAARRRGTLADRARVGGPANAEPGMLRASLVTNLLASFLLLYVLCWNLTTVSTFAMPERTVPVGLFLGLDQSWGMFAPAPSNEDGWYVIPGDLRDGTRTDLMSVTRDDYRQNGVSWEKPEYVKYTYKNERWRKYLENLWSQEHANERLYFGQYICREWNSRHASPKQVMDFQIVYMLEKTPPRGQQSTPEKVVTWEHSCF